MEAVRYLYSRVGGSWYVPTGNLGTSWRGEHPITNHYGHLQNTSKYAWFVEAGTGKYNPQSTKPDGWVYNFDGEFHFTEGQVPKNFMGHAVTMYESTYKTIFDEALRETVQRGWR